MKKVVGVRGRKIQILLDQISFDSSTGTDKPLIEVSTRLDVQISLCQQRICRVGEIESGFHNMVVELAFNGGVEQNNNKADLRRKSPYCWQS